MSPNDVQQIAFGALQGLGASTVFVLVLFIGFCVIVGFTKTKKTAGGAAMVVKSLDERISHRPFDTCHAHRAARPGRSAQVAGTQSRNALNFHATLSGCQRRPRLMMRCSTARS